MKTAMKIQRLNDREDGFASLVIAIVLIVILSLITVGFATLVRREQTNALNKQLSVQAFYAAESGVADARADINAGLMTTNKTDCSVPATGKLHNPQVDPDASHNVSYTCVKVNLTPNALTAQKLLGNNAWVTTAQTSSPLTKLTVSWKDSNANQTYQSAISNGFLPTGSSSWNTMGVLRVTIIPLNGTTSNIQRSTLVNNAFTTFLYPSSNSGDSNAVAYTTSAAGNGAVIGGHCAVPSGANYDCSADITFGGQTGPYIIHVVGYYAASDVSVTGTTSGGAATFTNSQAVIDSTGKAQDVLRRIQVAVPLAGDITADMPNEALEAGDVCKRMATNTNGTTFWDLSGAQTNSGPCYLQ